MSESFKAFAGVILILLVAATAFWLTNKPIRDLQDQSSDEASHEHHSHRRADAAPTYVTDFLQAIERGDAKVVEETITQHPDLLTQRFGSETALHVAARCNQAQLIDLLLQHHADPKARGQWDGTALHWACWFGSKAAAERLIAHGFNIEDKRDAFRSSPLLWAAHGSGNLNNPKGDYTGTVMLLLAKGAKADTRNGEGVPAVTMASSEVAAILLANGAKPPTTRPSAPSAALTT